MALATTSSAILALVGPKVPTQPLSSPSFFMDTKAPALCIISGVRFLGAITLPSLTYVSTDWRASRTRG